MRTARYSVVFALGFFALVAQTLLFRDFLAAFEGNELAIGGFFGSWLVWVALGACVPRLARPAVRHLGGRWTLHGWTSQPWHR